MLLVDMKLIYSILTKGFENKQRNRKHHRVVLSSRRAWLYSVRAGRSTAARAQTGRPHRLARLLQKGHPQEQRPVGCQWGALTVRWSHRSVQTVRIG